MKGTAKRYWTTDEVEERVKQKVKEERLKVVAEILTELEAAGYGVDWNLFEIIKKLEHTK